MVCVECLMCVIPTAIDGGWNLALLTFQSPSHHFPCNNSGRHLHFTRRHTPHHDTSPLDHSAQTRAVKSTNDCAHQDGCWLQTPRLCRVIVVNNRYPYIHANALVDACHHATPRHDTTRLGTARSTAAHNEFVTLCCVGQSEKPTASRCDPVGAADAMSDWSAWQHAVIGQ